MKRASRIRPENRGTQLRRGVSIRSDNDDFLRGSEGSRGSGREGGRGEEGRGEKPKILGNSFRRFGINFHVSRWGREGKRALGPQRLQALPRKFDRKSL